VHASSALASAWMSQVAAHEPQMSRGEHGYGMQRRDCTTQIHLYSTKSKSSLWSPSDQSVGRLSPKRARLRWRGPGLDDNIDSSSLA
jgi:hypothetical protein